MTPKTKKTKDLLASSSKSSDPENPSPESFKEAVDLYKETMIMWEEIAKREIGI